MWTVYFSHLTIFSHFALIWTSPRKVNLGVAFKTILLFLVLVFYALWKNKTQLIKFAIQNIFPYGLATNGFDLCVSWWNIKISFCLRFLALFKIHSHEIDPVTTKNLSTYLCMCVCLIVKYFYYFLTSLKRAIPIVQGLDKMIGTGKFLSKLKYS